MEGNGAEVEHGRDEVDAVEVHRVMRLEVIAESGGAERAIAFADEEFGRVPTAVAVDIESDELREGFYILVDAPKVLVLCFADGTAEAGAHRVDEDHIGFVEQRALIVLHPVRRRRSVFGVGGEDAARPESAHVQPNRGGAGAAVINEGYRPLRAVFAIGADVRSGIDQRLRLVPFLLW